MRQEGGGLCWRASPKAKYTPNPFVQNDELVQMARAQI